MKTTACLAVAVVALVWANSLLAHHSLANFDTTKAVRLKGTVAQFYRINPHSLVFLDATGPDGQMRRWAIEGPALRQLNRSGVAQDFLKPGDIIEVCGYMSKEPVVWQLATPEDHTNSVAGRLFNAEMLIMPDGTEHSWGDYHVHKCFPPGYTDHHSPR